MYTYRIYLDGGNLVIGTYESNVLKGEAKHLPRGLVAVAGNTNTTITLNRVVNNLPTLANIEHPDLRDSNGNVWGANRTAVIAAINSFIQSTGGGNVISVNGQTGTVSLGLQNLVNVTTITPTQGDVLSYNSSGNWVLNSGLQYLLSKVKSATATQTSLEVDNDYKINIDATQGKTTIVHAGSSVATFGAQKALLPGVTVGTTGNTYDLPAARGTATGQVPVFNASNNTTSFQAVKVADLSGSTDDLAQGATNLFFTSAEQSKLAGIQSGAEVNVNADWNSSSGDSQILNKPTLSTVATSGSYNDLSNLPSIPAAYTDSDVDNHLNTATATTGQILSWTGSDYDWVLDAAGAPAGTVGQLQYNNSGIFGASSNLFWDISNNRLGIGTSSPTRSLSVTGDASFGQAFITTSGPAQLHIGQGNSTAAKISTQRGVINIVGNTISDGSGGTNFFIINPMRANGAVFSAATTEINSDNLNLYYQQSDPDSNYIGAIRRQASGWFATNPHKMIGIGDSDYSNASAGTVLWYTNNQTYYKGLLLDKTGNVGIGTITPTDKLQANGSILSGVYGFVTPVAGKIRSVSPNTSYGEIGFSSQYNNLASGLRSYGVSDTTYARDLRFYVNDDTADSGDGDERMRITHTGNVGIGTTSPSAKLDVYGGESRFGTDQLGYVQILGNGGGGVVKSNKRLYLETFGGYDMDLKSTGNYNFKNNASTTYVHFDGTNERVGIGTALPSAKLHVNGNSILQGSVTPESIRFDGTISNGVSFQRDSYGFKIVGDSVGTIGTFRGSTNLISWTQPTGWGGAGPLSNGRVGIKAHNGPSTPFYVQDYGNNPLLYTTVGTGGLDGNVGIGTTTPAHKLDVNGTARFSGNTYLAGDILVANPTGDRYIQASNGTIGFLSSDSTGFNLWTKNSNVGIKSELYINSDLNYNAGIRLRIGSTQTSPSGYSYELSFNPRVNHVPTNVAIRTLDSSYGGSSTIPGPIYIFGGQNTTTGTYGHVILQSDFTASRGNVGIGTTTPSEKLHVVGKINLNDGSNNVLISTGNSTITATNTTAVGYQALTALTTGGSNTALGYRSGFNLTESTQNTLIGYESGFSKTGSTGRNVAIGHQSLYLDTVGYDNTAIGYQALYKSNPAYKNTAVGFTAASYTTGNYNSIFGAEAGKGIDTVSTFSNTVAIGYQALTALTTGTENTAIGYQAASTVTTAGGGTFIGHQAGQNRNRGGEVAVGRNALQNAGNGFYQTAVGYNAGQSGMGSYDIAIGWYAGAGAASGGFNIKIGETAGRFHTGTGCIIIGGSSLLTGTSSNVIAIGGGISAGSNTISIGHQSGNSNSTSSIFIGPQAGQNETGSNKLYIENSNSATPLIYGEFDTDLVRINGSFQVTSTTTSAGLYASNQTELRLYELTANGTNYIALKAAGTLAGDTTYTLPTADGSAGQTLTTDASGNMSWAYPKSPVKSEAGTAYTLVLADAGKYIRMTATTAITITIPQDIFAVGDEFFFEQNNTGQVTVAAGTGVTLRNTAAFLAKTAEQYAIIGLKCVASNEFILTGERELV